MGEATAVKERWRPNQINLVQAIMKELDRQGCSEINQRHINAVIGAADAIILEFEVPHKPAVPVSGLRAWLDSDDTGLSSKAMAARLAPLIGEQASRLVPFHHPLDPSDFGRCVRLLEAVPELRPHLPAMADVSPVWGRLVAVWGELEQLYREELPKGRAPRLYDRMRALIEADERGDSSHA